MPEALCCNGCEAGGGHGGGASSRSSPAARAPARPPRWPSSWRHPGGRPAWHRAPAYPAGGPTGKAAARPTESMGGALQALGEWVEAIPTEAGTLHRLLGVIPGAASSAITRQPAAPGPAGGGRGLQRWTCP